MCVCSGFHEAIGELMAMAAATPKYLNKIGLMEELVEDEEQVCFSKKCFKQR